MRKLPYLKRLPTTRNLAKKLLSCYGVNDVAKALETSKLKLEILAGNPRYQTFEIKKSDGSKRTIEDPHPDLKEILRRLNHLLQCVYWIYKTRAAYGYIIGNKSNKDKRNILTNAQRHIGNYYMLNADFEDFFHQVLDTKVKRIFTAAPFNFSEDAVKLLVALVCYNGRLPMGSPTSPVLSNFACINLDNELDRWANRNNITYTRFVDDLSFSSKNDITHKDLAEINAIVNGAGYFFNPDKIKWYGPAETKIVTGLEVTDIIGIPGSFYYELSQDLERLSKAVELCIMMYGRPEKDEMVLKYCEQIAGKVNFIGMVLGYEDEKYEEYAKRYQKALKPNINSLSMSWMDLPYDE